MSDEKDDKGNELEIDFDFDWGDPLADGDVEGSSTVPPPRGTKPGREPTRAFYRPPDPAEFKRPVPRPLAPRPAAPGSVRRRAEHVDAGAESDDVGWGDEEKTGLTAIPEDLIRSLAQAVKESDEPQASTRPPPADRPSQPSGGAVLDMDDLLSAFEGETRSYSEALPEAASVETPEPMRPTPAPSPGDVLRLRVPRPPTSLEQGPDANEELLESGTFAHPSLEREGLLESGAFERSASAEPVRIVDDDDDGPVIESEPTILESGAFERPALEIARFDDDVDDSEDDEPSISFAHEDDDDARLEVLSAGARDAEPEVAVARRSVRSRQPRTERFRFLGHSQGAVEARSELLSALIEVSTPAQKVRLLLAAAERDLERGHRDAAAEKVHEARQIDPRDAVALRMARSLALERNALADLASLLEAEAKLPVSRAERVAILLALSEVQLQQLDYALAEKAALEAYALAPRSAMALLLIAEARAAEGRDTAAADALGRAGDVWDDPRVRVVLWECAAREFEKSGETERALELYRRAIEAEPQAWGALFGVARSSRGREQAEALRAIGETMPSGALRDAFMRRAARSLMAVRGEDAAHDRELAETALLWLREARASCALRVRAAAALRMSDADHVMAPLEAWAATTVGAERAWVLTRIAELHVERGDVDRADETLNAAVLADSTFPMIPVLRERMARAFRDTPRARSTGALAAAAGWVRVPNGEAQERALAAEARREHEAPLTAQLLWLDLSARENDRASVIQALRAELNGAPKEHRVGALLVLQDCEDGPGDSTVPESALREALDHAENSLLIVRQLARRIARRDGQEAAALLLDEVDRVSGTLAAAMACEAGQLLYEAGQIAEAVGAYLRALEQVQAYPPALFSLEHAAHVAGDLDTLARVLEELASLAGGGPPSASYLVRASVHRADADPLVAAELLRRARALCPEDVLLMDLCLRAPEGFSDLERAELSLDLARDAEAGFGRALRLAAAARLEEARAPARAAELYRALVIEDGSDESAKLALERAELDAGEVARVAERRFAEVRDARSDLERVHALERLARLDMAARDDAASAVLSLHAILEVFPGHLPSLRALERYYVAQGRSLDLFAIEERLAEHQDEPEEAAAHLRFAARLLLAEENASGDAADELLVRVGPRVRLDDWMTHHLAAAARSTGHRELAASMDIKIAERASSPMVRATETIRVAASLALYEGQAARAAEMLEEAVSAAPAHPMAAEFLAHLRASMGEPRGAAEALEIAARAALREERQVTLWYQAAILWQDTVFDEERAVSALLAASHIDIGYLDVFERLRTLLELREEHRPLLELLHRRISLGAEAELLVSLRQREAELHELLGDFVAAREALRALLVHAPEQLDGLKRFAELSLMQGAHRDAADALIKIARLRQDRDELHWVFFTLGEIYGEHIPDPRRAEAAYRRALKLMPGDLLAMERLAVLLRREGRLEAAAEQLELLAQAEPEVERARDHRLSLAAVYSEMSDLRRAEQVLESARRTNPTDFVVLEALAELYRTQNAQAPLAIHANRAAADFRHALEANLADESAWQGLAQVLRWRGREDAARWVAQVGRTLGVESSAIELQAAAARGAKLSAIDASIEELLAPPSLPSALRAVMQAVAPTLDKVLPFNLRAHRAERLADPSVRRIVLELARSLKISEVDVWVTKAAPRVCVPVSSAPQVVLMVGSDVITLGENEQRFVFARALMMARLGLSVLVRTLPGELARVMAGLMHHFDSNCETRGIEPGVIAEYSRRIAKHLPRRASTELAPLVFELAGSPDYDPERLAMASSELGNRVGLLAVGSMENALSGLLSLSGEPGIARALSARIAQVERLPEAVALVHFALSELCFEARAQMGEV